MTCTKCKADLLEEDFHWRNRAEGKRRSRCKNCMSRWNKRYYAASGTRATSVKARRRADKKRNKLYVQEYLANHGCVDCPETDPVCLDFDHVRGKKLGEISDLVRRGFRLEAIQREIEKCDVRCANCHRKVTAKRRLVGSPGNDPDSLGFQASAMSSPAHSPI